MKKKLNNYFVILQRSILSLFRRYSIPRWLVFSFDVLAVGAGFLFAYLLRFNFKANDFLISYAFIHSVIALIVYALFFLLFRSYSGLIRRTTLTDISLVFAATTVSAASLLIFSLIAAYFEFKREFILPISIILIHYGIITIFLFSLRLAIKLLFRIATRSVKKLQNVLIYGAGELGFIIKRHIMSDPKYEMNVVGFLDDNKQLHAKKINDIPVLNPASINTEFLEKRKIKIVIIAIKNLSVSRKNEIIRSALDLGLTVLKITPGRNIEDDKIDSHNLEKIKIEDLLDRGPNSIDTNRIKNGIKARTILVTGASGSVGIVLAKQIAEYKPQKLILLDIAETPLLQLEYELKRSFNDISFHLELADVSIPGKMETVFWEHKPDIVFHVASYKHIPLMEISPHEAFRVNVLGTKIVAELSLKYNASKFVLISSNKCFKPSGVMSVSKRLSEIMVQALASDNKNSTRFMITRFGNLLGSSGSVIPLFYDQIRDGGPVTVTHPDISRYFISMTAAGELILETAFIEDKSEIYNFDMGEAVKITDIADKMIRMSGLLPGQDIEIEFSGLRPGEKLEDEIEYEVLKLIPTSNPAISRVEVDNTDFSSIAKKIVTLNKDLYSFSKGEIIEFMENLIK